MAALRKPEVYRIPAIRDAQQNGDPVDWLMRRVSVYFPGRAEVMAVSVTRDDPAEAQALVKAIVDSYLTEVVSVERDRKRQRLNELNTVCAAKEQDIREKHQQMKSLGLETGTTDTEMLSVRNRLALEELATMRGEMARTQSKMGELRAELAGQKALLSHADDVPADPVELEILINSDPVARELSVTLGYKALEQLHNERVLKGGATTPSDERKVLQAQFDARVEALRKKVLDRQRGVVIRKIIELEAQLKDLDEEQAAAAKVISEMLKQTQEIGITTVDLEMLRQELKSEEQLASELNMEKERLRIEFRAPTRITLVEPAELPLTPSNLNSRMALTATAMLVAFCCPVAVVIFRYVHTCRIKTADG